MLYFFHHYELPVILQQAQLQHLLFRNHAQPGMADLSPEQPSPSLNRALTSTEATPEPSPARESAGVIEPEPTQETSSTSPAPAESNSTASVVHLEERVEITIATPSSTEEQNNKATENLTESTASNTSAEASTQPKIEEVGVSRNAASSSKIGDNGSSTDTSTSEGFEVIEATETTRKETTSCQDK